MANDVLAEALARIEYKVDLLISHLNVRWSLPMSMGGTCPVCKALIDYQVDIMKQVVVRKCKCGTGKIILSISLNQPPAGVEVGKTTSNETNTTGDYPADLPSDDGRRR